MRFDLPCECMFDTATAAPIIMLLVIAWTIIPSGILTGREVDPTEYAVTVTIPSSTTIDRTFVDAASAFTGGERRIFDVGLLT